MDEDSRLVGKIQKHGDRAAADTLIRKYYDEIYIYMYRQVTDKHKAMDLTQDIFMSMLSSICSYSPKQAGFRTWLYRIATNKVVDYYRSRAVHNKYFLETAELEPYDETDFTRKFEADDLLERVKAYVNGLDADTQKIFRLKFFAEYTFGEIAASLHMPESSVKSKYYRLLYRLKEEFKNDYK